MTTLKLIKGLSYSGAVRATKANPLVEVEDDETVAYLLAEGHFIAVDVPTTESTGNTGEETGDDETDDETPEGIIQQDGGEETPTPEQLNDMTVAELKAYAEKHSIDVSKCSKKADYMQAISVFYGGSYTMMETQQSPNKEV